MAPEYVTSSPVDAIPSAHASALRQEASAGVGSEGGVMLEKF